MSLLKLQQMIDSGKTYYYRQQPAVIKSFDTVHGEIEILVELDGQPQKFIKENEAKLDLFLVCFKEVPVVDIIEAEVQTNGKNLPADQRQQKYVPDLYVESKGSFKSLTDLLMADIEKVRSDPGYVNQAKQVCNNVSAIVNITKLQLQLLQNG